MSVLFRYAMFCRFSCLVCDVHVDVEHLTWSTPVKAALVIGRSSKKMLCILAFRTPSTCPFWCSSSWGGKNVPNGLLNRRTNIPEQGA